MPVHKLSNIIVFLCLSVSFLFLFTPARCGTWSEAGVHPTASAQASSWGRQLHALAAWNGKLYSGYGDDGANTGPIHIVSFDPVTKTFADEWTCQTEEIDIFRPLLGRLYVPADDPRDPSAAAYAVLAPGGAWADRLVDIPHGFDVAHTFDMTSLTGTDLWLVGSAYKQGTYPGAVFRSQDGGTSWEWMIDRAKTGSDTLESYVRFYWAGTLTNKLYIQCNEDDHSMVFDGSGWADGPSIVSTMSLAYCSAPVAFAGKLVSRKNWAFDGVRKYGPLDPTASGSLRDIAVSGDALYLLYSGYVRRTTDLSTFTTVTAHSLGSSAASLAVLNGKLYIGTSDSRIYEYSDPVSTLPSVALLVTDEYAGVQGFGNAAFVIKRFGSVAGPLTVSFSLAGTARNGVDYHSLPASVTIPSGSDTVTVTVEPVAGHVMNGSRSLLVKLAAGSDYDAASPADGLIMITDQAEMHFPPLPPEPEQPVTTDTNVKEADFVKPAALHFGGVSSVKKKIRELKEYKDARDK